MRTKQKEQEILNKLKSKALEKLSRGEKLTFDEFKALFGEE